MDGPFVHRSRRREIASLQTKNEKIVLKKKIESYKSPHFERHHYSRVQSAGVLGEGGTRKEINYKKNYKEDL